MKNTKKIKLTERDILEITLPNGNSVRIETIAGTKISNIEFDMINNEQGEISIVDVTSFGTFTDVATWFKGGVKKISKKSSKKWFSIGTENKERFTIFKS